MSAVHVREELVPLLKDVAARSADFEQQRHISDDIIARFKQIGVYRALVPKAYGGEECSPAQFCELIEQIATADGSAGWVASFGMSPFYLGALPPDTLKALYRDGPDVVFAGGIFPPQKAVLADGGYRVSGRWGFASGSMGASVFGVGILPESGEPLPRMAVLPRDSVQIDPVWNTVGLAGTGSHDLVVNDAFVPQEWTFVRGGALNLDGALYRYPVLSLATQVLSVVALGVARAALNEIYTIAHRQQSVTGAPRLADRPQAQMQIARCEADLRSARAWFYDAIDDVWQCILAGDEPACEQINALRLSSTHVTRAAAEVTRQALALNGMGGITMTSPLQRYVRDTLVITQHAFMGDLSYLNAGTVYFGGQPLPGYL
ncbi:acyl-CoA dehydrogenase family protein [Leclercia adecarboxylata]|uniref:Acyl-CoA dehydrogenase n=1 Tax=Leclercia adecarboxylata TaxID=83655 RepID=A0A855ES54_9ENTR|nr:acyl-CoA dehydrogenase family protein [Leclercia adecarboxylata]KFC98743.1 pigment protein [Leclercia adecarboxylata ATCC 23216 = NBRC 102595]PHH04631.1 acyl-CoA dehydrogenase [Leclercia adecarboxylata]UBH68759.1 acyl-CoA dehydrogenase family protein [Leclercia adecarboxylata]SPX65710.1 Flavin-dependent monooxygenase, oxygenase subunit HsaA [Leclercia adecarboxylata]STX27425.1 Flavin-dependent monooxygenase, oxygenase subunit HsaA [Leclercia adecarboxylata]